MAITIETSKIKTPEQRIMTARAKIAANHIDALAVLNAQDLMVAPLREELGIEQVVEIPDIDTLLTAQTTADGRRLTSAVEIQSPDGSLPEIERRGIKTRTLDLVQGLGHRALLGRVDISVGEGTSIIALMHQERRIHAI